MSGIGALSAPKRYKYYQGPAQGETLGAFIQRQYPAQLIEFGAVYVNHKRCLDPSRQIGSQDVIRVHMEPKRYLVDLIHLKSRIIFENENFLILDKPSGLPMHPTLDNYYENLVKALESILSIKLYITHRLDVPTSGLVLIAKNKDYQTLFNRLIANRLLKKTYSALVGRPLNPGLYRHWMLASEKSPKEVFVIKPDSVLSDECLLEITSSQPFNRPEDKNLGNLYKLEINLLTGRTHQIRAQLSKMGAPIIGDEMYGGIESDVFGLLAVQMAFTCPKTQRDFRFSRI